MANVRGYQFYDFANELADHCLVVERGEVIRQRRGDAKEADRVRRSMSIRLAATAVFKTRSCTDSP